jgi:zinc transport system permease protein
LAEGGGADVSLLGYEFMRRALLAAALVGVAAPSIGIVLVQRRLSLMGDGIGHVAFAGVAAGFVFATSPVITAMGAAALAAIAIEFLRDRGRTAGDLALALIFYGGLAAGALLTYLAGASNRVLEYLFGSVLTVTPADLRVTLVTSAIVLAVVAALRKQLFAVCYDEETAKVAGLPVRGLNLLIALVAAITIAVTMRVVGILLVSAMLVLPVAAAQQLTRSFGATMMVSSLLGLALSVGGLVAAFYVDVAPGATIVLAAVGAFVLAAIAGRLLTWGRS